MTDLPNVDPESRAETLMAAPDKIAKVRELFGVDSDMEVPAFSEADERVPDLDPTYVFDPDTTMAICAGFSLTHTAGPESRCSSRAWVKNARVALQEASRNLTDSLEAWAAGPLPNENHSDDKDSTR